MPSLLRSYEERRGRAGVELLVLGPGTRTGIPVRYDDPREVGPDRIANAVGARERYGAPCIVVDFGTTTNFDVVSPEGEYVGGVIAPGIEVSMQALFGARGAALHRRLRRAADGDRQEHGGEPSVRARLRLRRAGGRNRARPSAAELGVEAPTVATGGLADLIVPHARTLERIDPFLTLEGLRLVWERNPAERLRSTFAAARCSSASGACRRRSAALLGWSGRLRAPRE